MKLGRRLRACLLCVAVLVSTQAQVQAKVASCKTRFSKSTSSEYCSKFGTAQHTTMVVSVKSKIHNFASLANNANVESVKLEIAIIKDQDYDKLSKSSCYEKRGAASALLPVMVPTNGKWSTEIENADTVSEVKLFSLNRARLYYVEVLDCTNELL